jgi:hypothetical protein
MATRKRALQDAISALAAVYEHGELMASTDPAQLLYMAAADAEVGRLLREGADRWGNLFRLGWGEQAPEWCAWIDGRWASGPTPAAALRALLGET